MDGPNDEGRPRFSPRRSAHHATTVVRLYIIIDVTGHPPFGPVVNRTKLRLSSEPESGQNCCPRAYGVNYGRMRWTWQHVLAAVDVKVQIADTEADTTAAAKRMLNDVVGCVLGSWDGLPVDQATFEDTCWSSLDAVVIASRQVQDKLVELRDIFDTHRGTQDDGPKIVRYHLCQGAPARVNENIPHPGSCISPSLEAEAQHAEMQATRLRRQQQQTQQAPAESVRSVEQREDQHDDATQSDPRPYLYTAFTPPPNIHPAFEPNMIGDLLRRHFPFRSMTEQEVDMFYHEYDPSPSSTATSSTATSPTTMHSQQQGDEVDQDDPADVTPCRQS